MRLPKRPYYETNIAAEMYHDNDWYNATITALAFPANPDSAKPDVPVSCDVKIGNEEYKIEILRYEDNIIYGKIGVSKDVPRVIIVVEEPESD